MKAWLASVQIKLLKKFQIKLLKKPQRPKGRRGRTPILKLPVMMILRTLPALQTAQCNWPRAIMSPA